MRISLVIERGKGADKKGFHGHEITDSCHNNPTVSRRRTASSIGGNGGKTNPGDRVDDEI